MVEITGGMAGAIRYDQVRPDGTITLTPEEAERFEKQAKALTKLLADKAVVAKYKVEVTFGKARSMTNPTPGAVSFWSSGSRFHGGGDEKLYLCPGSSLGVTKCSALLQDSYNSSLGAVCPSCGQTWKQEQLIGELLFNLPMRKWAEVLYRYYRLCEYNCDIYLKFAPTDVRSVALEQADRQTWRGSQRLERARSNRTRLIYPLRNIIKDTSAGADLLGRFYALLVA